MMINLADKIMINDYMYIVNMVSYGSEDVPDN